MARICVLVSDLDLAALLTEVLTDRGHEVIASCAANEVVGHVQREQPDLLVIDAWLDTPTRGVDIAERLAGQGSGRHVPAIVLASDHQQVGGKEQWLAAHNIRVLFTPFDMTAFDQAVDESLTS